MHDILCMYRMYKKVLNPTVDVETITITIE